MWAKHVKLAQKSMFKALGVFSLRHSTSGILVVLLMMFACGSRSRDASIISTRRVSLRVIKSSKVGRAFLLQRLLLIWSSNTMTPFWV